MESFLRFLARKTPLAPAVDGDSGVLGASGAGVDVAVDAGEGGDDGAGEGGDDGADVGVDCDVGVDVAMEPDAATAALMVGEQL